MTDIVDRCIDAATEVPEFSYGNGMYDADIPAIVRAVLAEAGVDELVAALQGLLDNTLSNQAPRGLDAVMNARAALAKARS